MGEGQGQGHRRRRAVMAGGVVTALLVLLVVVVTVLDDGSAETGSFPEEIDAAGDLVVRRVALEAGEALRARVEGTEEGFEPLLALAVEPAAADDAVASLLGTTSWPTSLLDAYSALAPDDIDEAGGDLREDMEDVDGLVDQVAVVSEAVPDLVDRVGVPLGQAYEVGTDRDGVYETVATPFAAEYLVVVAGADRSVGAFELTIETHSAPPGFDGIEPWDEIEQADYVELLLEHQRFFCDEGHRDGVDDALLDDAYYGDIILRGEFTFLTGIGDLCAAEGVDDVL